jgi:hypothetical protein
MAKAAYAKNIRSVRAFCVLIKKKGCDVMPYPFLLFVAIVVSLYFICWLVQNCSLC